MKDFTSQPRSSVVQVVGFVMTVFGLVQDRFDGQKKDRGATAVEYGLLVGLIAIVIIVAVTALGGQLQQIFSSIAKSLGGGKR